MAHAGGSRSLIEWGMSSGNVRCGPKASRINSQARSASSVRRIRRRWPRVTWAQRLAVEIEFAQQARDLLTLPALDHPVRCPDAERAGLLAGPPQYMSANASPGSDRSTRPSRRASGSRGFADLAQYFRNMAISCAEVRYGLARDPADSARSSSSCSGNRDGRTVFLAC